MSKLLCFYSTTDDRKLGKMLKRSKRRIATRPPTEGVSVPARSYVTERDAQQLVTLVWSFLSIRQVLTIMYLCTIQGCTQAKCKTDTTWGSIMPPHRREGVTTIITISSVHLRVDNVISIWMFLLLMLLSLVLIVLMVNQGITPWFTETRVCYLGFN